MFRQSKNKKYWLIAACGLVILIGVSIGLPKMMAPPEKLETVTKPGSLPQISSEDSKLPESLPQANPLATESRPASGTQNTSSQSESRPASGTQNTSSQSESHPASNSPSNSSPSVALVDTFLNSLMKKDTVGLAKYDFSGDIDMSSLKNIRISRYAFEQIAPYGQDTKYFKVTLEISNSSVKEIPTGKSVQFILTVYNSENRFDIALQSAAQSSLSK